MLSEMGAYGKACGSSSIWLPGGLLECSQHGKQCLFSGMHLSGLIEEPADLPSVYWIGKATHDAKLDSCLLVSMQLDFAAKIRIWIDTR